MKTIGTALCLGVFLGCLGVQSLNAAPLGPRLALNAGTSNATVETVDYRPGSGFHFPRSHGAIVDWCAVWAHECGWAGATQFCQTRGFERALSWEIFHPGHTFVIGAHQHCEGDACKGFSFVRCD
jgi:hypothetical protein